MILAALALAGTASQSSNRPAYQAWAECLKTGAGALSAGPDTADAVTRALFIVCAPEERAARAELARVMDDEAWAANRAHLADLAFAKVIQRRAERINTQSQ